MSVESGKKAEVRQLPEIETAVIVQGHLNDLAERLGALGAKVDVSIGHGQRGGQRYFSLRIKINKEKS